MCDYEGHKNMEKALNIIKIPFLKIRNGFIISNLTDDCKILPK